MTTRSKWRRQNYKDLYGTLQVKLKTKENVTNRQKSLHFTSSVVYAMFFGCALVLCRILTDF